MNGINLTLLLSAAGILVIACTLVPIRFRLAKIDRTVAEEGRRLLEEGADKHYEKLQDEELLGELENLTRELKEKIRSADYKRTAELGCRIRLIENILKGRGLTLPE